MVRPFDVYMYEKCVITTYSSKGKYIRSWKELGSLRLKVLLVGSGLIWGYLNFDLVFKVKYCLKQLPHRRDYQKISKICWCVT